MKKKNLIFMSSTAIVCALGFGLQVHAYDTDNKPTDNSPAERSSQQTEKPAKASYNTTGSAVDADSTVIQYQNTCSQGHLNCDGLHANSNHQNHDRNDHSGSAHHQSNLHGHNESVDHHGKHHN